MPDQHSPLGQIEQLVSHFTVVDETLSCQIPVGDVACPQLPIPVAFDTARASRPTLNDYMDAAADHIVEYHPGLLDTLPTPTSREEIKRAQRQVQEREDADFLAGKTEGTEALSHPEKGLLAELIGAYRRGPDGLYSEAPREEGLVETGDFTDVEMEKGIRVEHFHTADPPPHARENWRATHLATGLTAEVGVDRQAPNHEAITSYQLRARVLADLRESVKGRSGRRPARREFLDERLATAEQVSFKDLMTDAETRARFEYEARLPEEIVRACVEAFERVHPHDRQDAEIIVRKVAVAALQAHEATREADEQKIALAKHVAEQKRIRQLPGLLVADEAVYSYRFVDRAQRRILDEVPPELSGVLLSATFKLVPQGGTSLVILRDPTPGSLQQSRLPWLGELDLLVDTLPTVLRVLFGETPSTIGVPEGNHTYVVAVHPDLLSRIDGEDPDGEPPTTEKTQEGS
jgi:hypothetical protein